jgi:hypothetical protein
MKNNDQKVTNCQNTKKDPFERTKSHEKRKIFC